MVKETTTRTTAATTTTSLCSLLLYAYVDDVLMFSLFQVFATVVASLSE